MGKHSKHKKDSLENPLQDEELSAAILENDDSFEALPDEMSNPDQTTGSFHIVSQGEDALFAFVSKDADDEDDAADDVSAEADDEEVAINDDEPGEVEDADETTPDAESEETTGSDVEADTDDDDSQAENEADNDNDDDIEDVALDDAEDGEGGELDEDIALDDDVEDVVLDEEDEFPATGVSKWSRRPAANAIDEPKEKGPRNLKPLWITLACILGVLIAGYIGASIFFMSHFGFNTSINDVDCSFKTIEEAQQLIETHVDNYSIKVIERTGSNESIEGSAIDLAYMENDVVDSYLEQQNSFLWFVRPFSHEAADELRVDVSFDETKLKTVTEALACMQPANMKAPTDAYAKFDGKEYVIEPETQGTTLDGVAVLAALTDAVSDTANTVDLDAEGCYVKPLVFSDDKALAEKIKLYNTYIPFSIVYTFGDKTEVVAGDTVISWFDISAAGTATLNEESIRTWVADFAARHDTVGTTREFTRYDGSAATVSGGIYGWSIDEEAEVAALVEACNAKKSQTREPIYISTADSYDTPDWGTSYIDLSLSEQHIWVIVDGAVVFDTDVVTGLPTAAKRTPEGTWMILEMVRNKTLRGQRYPDGSYEYETPVAYWMRMTWTGCGFHDATWQPWFGGNRYTYAGSHGCINMSYSDAQTLYSIVWTGMPVVCHY